MPESKLIDMKRDEPDEKAGECCMPCQDAQQYPYGLNIRLDQPDLAKLGITTMPAVGSEVKGEFVGVVTSCSQGLNEHDKPSMSVQIVMLKCAVEAEPAGNPTPKAAGGYKQPHIVG